MTQTILLTSTKWLSAREKQLLQILQQLNRCKKCNSSVYSEIDSNYGRIATIRAKGLL